MLINNKWPTGQSKVAIIFCISPIYTVALFWCGQIGRNAKFLLPLQSSKTATKKKILVAIVLWIKELTEYLHQ